MSRDNWKTFIRTEIIIILIVISPFLPGPSFMSIPTNIAFSLSQLASIFGLILIPIGLIILITEFVKNKEVKLTSLLLWSIPATLFISSFWIASYTREISRDLAIYNANRFINTIETYKEKNGQFPDDVSKLSTLDGGIPSPWIMGISDYNYEKKNNTYNISFSQNVILGFNSEIVVYDPSNNHVAEGELTTLYETGHLNWKSYIYD